MPTLRRRRRSAQRSLRRRAAPAVPARPHRGLAGASPGSWKIMPLRRRGPACTINTVDDAELLGEIETRQLLLSGPTGWAKVDAIVRDIAANVAQGKSEHDYQGVGHL